jgi:hypothetical protein
MHVDEFVVCELSAIQAIQKKEKRNDVGIKDTYSIIKNMEIVSL